MATIRSMLASNPRESKPVLDYAPPVRPAWLNTCGGRWVIALLTAAATSGAMSIATLERDGWFAASAMLLLLAALVCAAYLDGRRNGPRRETTDLR